MNDSDWNAAAHFNGPNGVERLDAHLRGHADSVTIEAVPGPSGEEMLVLFRAEAGHTGAAVRVRDILALTLKHCPKLWQEVQAASATPCDNSDARSRGME